MATDGPCTASVDLASGFVSVDRPSAGTCIVRLTLTNADVYQMTMQFAPSGGECCAAELFAVDASALQLLDGGSGG